MTKGQNAAVDFIEDFLKSSREGFSWQDLSEYVSTKAKVRNWLTVRSIIQFALNNNWIKRSNDIRKEEYIKLRSI